MMQRSRANEIPDLIRRLGSRSKRRVDESRARLSIIGGRAVEELVAALEGNENRIRARVMPLLAMIQDLRGREPLIAMLLDRNPHMRRIAARSLARFPSSDTVAALNRLLDRERRRDVRVAAVQSLVEQYAAGQDQAIRRVLNLLFDPRQHASIRLAAFSLLRALPSNQRRGVLAKLREDPDETIRRRAGELHHAEPFRFEPEQARVWLDDLASEDYDVWNEAVQRLGACDGRIVEPLICEMRRRAHDPDYCTRAGMALKALGPRRGRALAGVLDRVDEPFPLQVLVEVIGAIDEKSLIYRLKELIERLSAKRLDRTDPDGFDPMLRVRAKAHLELARIGSRVAIHDLRETLGESERRVELELLAAMRLIGKRDEIALLLTAHAREDAFTRDRIAEVVRAIMKRERIRRNNRIFRSLTPRQRESVKAILPPSTTKNRRPRSSRPPTP
jgi:HEAT repeat protein